jgi:hypothetical protein
MSIRRYGHEFGNAWLLFYFAPKGCATHKLDKMHHNKKTPWLPFQTHCFSENLEAPVIEPRTSGSAARNSDLYTTEAVQEASYD